MLALTFLEIRQMFSKVKISSLLKDIAFGIFFLFLNFQSTYLNESTRRGVAVWFGAMSGQEPYQ